MDHNKIANIIKAHFILLFIISLASSATAQEAYWDAYLAQYEEGPGSITLNMSLIEIAPVHELPFLLISRVDFENCTPDGLPQNDAFDALYDISDKVETALSINHNFEPAATFTYKCTRADYIYLSDTTSVRQQLESLKKDHFSDTQYSVRLMEDETWEAYRLFLYPDDLTLEYMKNEDVINSLTQAGDNLSKSRPVDHWLYFSTEKDRLTYSSFAEKLGFSIVETFEDNELDYTFVLKISKAERIDLASLSDLTLKLKIKADELNGVYDGWETMVIKK